jgi:hypothetical protein
MKLLLGFRKCYPAKAGIHLLNTSLGVKWAIPWESVPHSGAAGSGAAL